MTYSAGESPKRCLRRMAAKLARHESQYVFRDKHDKSSDDPKKSNSGELPAAVHLMNNSS